MRGVVLDFSVQENAGALTSDDGQRYYFGGADWKTAGALPQPGTRVDFEVEDTFARKIYVFVEPSADDRVTDGLEAESNLDSRYRGIYCSSDEGMLLGLCAG